MNRGDETSQSERQRLANWLPFTAGRPARPSALNGSSTSVTVPPAAVIAGFSRLRHRVGVHVDLGRDLAAGEDLDVGALADDAVGHQHVDRDVGIAELLDEVAERVQVDRLVLDAERVVEPLQLRDALLEWHLATLEAAGDRVAGALALGATAGRLAALAAGTATDALGVLRGAGCRRQIMDLHGQLSFSDWLESLTVIRWGTRAIMPRISGRSGSVFVLPILPSPSARSVPRCFGLVPIDDLICVTVMVASAMSCSRGGGGLRRARCTR